MPEGILLELTNSSTELNVQYITLVYQSSQGDVNFEKFVKLGIVSKYIKSSARISSAFIGEHRKHSVFIKTLTED